MPALALDPPEDISKMGGKELKERCEWLGEALEIVKEEGCHYERALQR